MGPNLYSFDDFAAVKTIYGHGTQFRKGYWYDMFSLTGEPDKERGNVFAMRDIKQHSQSRRHYAGVYAMSSLITYEPSVNNCIETFTNKMRMSAKSGETIDLSKWFQYYAFDVIGEITVSSAT